MVVLRLSEMSMRALYLFRKCLELNIYICETHSKLIETLLLIQFLCLYWHIENFKAQWADLLLPFYRMR
jgi:hypothetical protein